MQPSRFPVFCGLREYCALPLPVEPDSIYGAIFAPVEKIFPSGHPPGSSDYFIFEPRWRPVVPLPSPCCFSSTGAIDAYVTPWKRWTPLPRGHSGFGGLPVFSFLWPILFCKFSCCPFVPNVIGGLFSRSPFSSNGSPILLLG